MGGIPHKHFPNTGLGETNGLGLLICKKEPFACISLKFVRCPDGSTPNTFKVSVSEPRLGDNLRPLDDLLLCLRSVACNKSYGVPLSKRDALGSTQQDWQGPPVFCWGYLNLWELRSFVQFGSIMLQHLGFRQSVFISLSIRNLDSADLW
jgi:hypothetical protein